MNELIKLIKNKYPYSFDQDPEKYMEMVMDFIYSEIKEELIPGDEEDITDEVYGSGLFNRYFDLLGEDNHSCLISDITEFIKNR
jgi:hypothetical protein